MTTIKNQIKSFTASSIQKELNNYFVFLGGISGTSQKIDETDITLVSRITKDETSVVVPRVNWTTKDYTPYYISSSGENTYCYNNLTDIVYLCVGKNQSTGLGLITGDIIASEQPAHSYGIQTYSDGYSWMALYRIDLGLSKFLTETVMPVSNLNDFTLEIDSGSYLSKYSSICNGSPGATGNCYFYYTQRTKDPIGVTVYNIGDLVNGIGSNNWNCSTCHEFGKSLGYKTVHRKTTSSSTIDRTPELVLQNEINTLKLDVNDRYYIHYKNYEYQTQLTNAIVNLQLDITQLSIKDRIVNSQNPTVIILDGLGDGATARIETYYDIVRNAFIANGITLLTGGSMYINPGFNIPDGTVALENAIKAIIIPDIYDPSSFLPNPKVSVIKNVYASDLDNTYATNQTIFSKVGIVKNVLDNVNLLDPTVNAVSNETILGRTTAKVRVSPSEFPCPTCFTANPNLSLDEVYLENKTESGNVVVTIKTTNNTANSADYSSKIVSLESDAFGSTIEISGTDELSYDVLTTADIIRIDGTDYEVDTITEPDYRVSNVEYITKRVLPTNIVFDKTTGTESSAKLTFLI
jgi:hypothetical protein